MAGRKTVGIKELKNNLSAYLREVRRGRVCARVRSQRRSSPSCTSPAPCMQPRKTRTRCSPRGCALGSITLPKSPKTPIAKVARETAEGEPQRDSSLKTVVTEADEALSLESVGGRRVALLGESTASDVVREMDEAEIVMTSQLTIVEIERAIRPSRRPESDHSESVGAEAPWLVGAGTQEVDHHGARARAFWRGPSATFPVEPVQNARCDPISLPRWHSRGGVSPISPCFRSIGGSPTTRRRSG